MRFLVTLVVSACVGLAMGCGTESPGKQTPAVETNLQFRDATATSGVNFRHEPTRTEKRWMPETMVAGVAVADFNRDGAPDLIFTNGGMFGEMERNEKTLNRLFLNDGKGTFADRTNKWGLPSSGYGNGAAIGDFDNDGWTDLFLTNYEGDNRLLRNTGEKFVDVTEEAGIKRDEKWATSAGFADFDLDGDLDLFVVKYIVYKKEEAVLRYRNGIPVYSAPYQFPGLSDQLLRNDGNGKFTDVSEESGISGPKDKGLALAIGDIDKDGDMDVYVANDTTPNQLWINDGSGKFKDMAKLSGCAYSEIGLEEGSMGADFSDIDGDGLLDIAVTNFQAEATAVYKQTAPMLFREVSDSIGVGESSRVRLSFGIEFFDADNDGDEDLASANGHIEDNISVNSGSISFEQQNTIYLNSGDGNFVDVSDGAGDALQDKQVSRGLVVADLDSDGDLDFVVANNGGTAQVALNETKDMGNYVGLWLEGSDANRNAIGTRLIATVGEKKIERQVMGAQSYLGVSDLRVLIGIGGAEKIDSVEIIWPKGEKQFLKDVSAGKYFYLRQGGNLQPMKPGTRLDP